MYKVLRTISCIFVLLFAVSDGMGQVATGTYTYGTYDNKGFDTINVGNLNVHSSIPVLNKAGRGMSFTYSLSYDSSIWHPSSVNGSLVWTPANYFGWGADTNVITGYVSYSTTTTKTPNPLGPSPPKGGKLPTCTVTTYDNWTYYDPLAIPHAFDGSTSTLVSGDPDTCPQPSMEFTEVASDGSGYTLHTSHYTRASITSSGGVSIVPAVSGNSAGTVTDSNGNEITVDGSGHFTDTTGNVVLTVTGVAPSAHTFQYKDASGNSQTVSMSYRTYTVQTAFGCSGVGEYGPTSTSLVDAITFPDNSAYHFSYESTIAGSTNVTGRLAGVQLPQGGTIQYAYSGGSNGIVCADGSTAGLTRTLNSDSGSATSTWTYSRTAGTGTSQTAVADGLGNHKIFNFVEASNQPSGTTAAYYETSRSIYQGPASGTPPIARNTCYNGVAPPCTTTAFTLPIAQIDTYETLDGLQTRGTTAKYDTNGSQTEADTFDFGGSASRGGFLNREFWAYGGNIAGLPTYHTVYDGNNNMAGETVYGYDLNYLTASSGVPQHVTAGTARGNLSAITKYASPSLSYSSRSTYEDTGSPLTVTSPNGTTTLSYDSTFVYNTGTSLPTPSSGVSLGTSASFDTSYSGLPLTATDANSQITSVSSYDSMLRATRINSPDGGVTTRSYSPTQLSEHVYQSSSTYADTETQYDGYGRQSRLAIANGQSGNSWYQKDTCYDANGNTSFVSYWYQGAGFNAAKVCSGAGDIYAYDVLGRLKTVTRANGESLNYTYLGRATKSVDTNGVARILQIDGLGRSTVVCEISSNSTMPGSGSPTSCGTDISGTGFTTNYSYSLASGTTTVTQGGQTRTFQQDWLGRTTSVTEPESGTTTYSYAYNTTGLAVTRKRPRANQTNASTLTTTTKQYDTQGRIVSVTYDDGTPTKTFAYDSSAGWSSLAQNNLKGHLSRASVSNASTVFSYDAVGRTVDLAECLPSGCGTAAYDRTLHYSYDLAGNMLSSTDGGGVQSTYSVSLTGNPLSLTSSLNNSTNPANIVSNVSFGPNGPLNWNIGNGLSGVASYDALGRLNGGWVCQGSTSGYCAGGTQMYGFTAGWSGDRLTGSADSVLNQGSTYGYDEFNRLTSRTVNSGTTANFTYVYDRWGNRVQQNVTAGSGPTPQLSFNTGTNQITGSGYAYDAAGNMTSDGFHAYTYDAEGNVTAVDGGATSSYVYDALNHRVKTVASGTATEFVFNTMGQRVSEWNGSTHVQLKGKYYWGSRPVAYYTPGGAVHFEHQDWLGTERKRTAYNAIVESTATSLPFGDAQISSATDGDAYHFAMLDSDSESGTDHAQFRQYSSTQGRWLSPDPYSGSYDFSNPQSLNRYSYVLNGPLAYTDMLGLDRCEAKTIITLNPVNNTVLSIEEIVECTVSAGGGRDSPGVTYLPPTYIYVNPTGGGGGGGGSASSTSGTNNATTKSGCLGQALASDGNGASLALDVVGVGAGFLPGGGLVTGSARAATFAFGAQVGLTAASTGVSIAYKSGQGMVAGILGGQVALTAKTAESLAVDFGKSIPIVGVAVSGGALLYDGYQTYKAYHGCMTGVHN